MGRWRTENFTIYVDVYTVCIVCLELETQGGVDTLKKRTQFGSYITSTENKIAVWGPGEFFKRYIELQLIQDSPVSAVFWSPANRTIGKTSLIEH